MEEEEEEEVGNGSEIVVTGRKDVLRLASSPFHFNGTQRIRIGKQIKGKNNLSRNLSSGDWYSRALHLHCRLIYYTHRRRRLISPLLM